MVATFTSSFRTVLVTANKIAHRYGHPFVGCGHLLLAALETSDVANRIFSEACRVEVLREQLEASLSPAESGGVRQAILYASNLKDEDFADFPDIPHLIAGLVEHPDPDLSAVLLAANVDVQQLKARNRQVARELKFRKTDSPLDKILSGTGVVYSPSVDDSLRRLAQLMPPAEITPLVTMLDAIQSEQEMEAYEQRLAKAANELEERQR